MKILRVSKNCIDISEHRILEGEGLVVHCLSPTLLSALTSVKITVAQDKEDYEFIFVNNQTDAVAAASARKITKNKNFKIVYEVMPNDDMPKNIHKEVIKVVDLWIAPSPRVYDLLPDGVTKATVMPVSLADARSIPMPTENLQVVLAWIGEIDNSCTLRETLQTAQTLHGDFTLRICGAGKARAVMPLVKMVRGFDNKDKIVWVGEKYDAAAEIENAHALVMTHADRTVGETAVCQGGKCVLAPAELQNFIDSPHALANPEDFSTNTYINNLKNFLINHRP